MKPPEQSLRACQFLVLRYARNPVTEEFVNLGVILIEEPGFAGVRFGDLSRVTRLDPDADIELLQALERDIRNTLTSATERGLMLQSFLDSLSNMIQLSEAKGCLTDDPEHELELLAHMYLT